MPDDSSSRSQPQQADAIRGEPIAEYGAGSGVQAVIGCADILRFGWDDDSVAEDPESSHFDLFRRRLAARQVRRATSDYSAKTTVGEIVGDARGVSRVTRRLLEELDQTLGDAGMDQSDKDLGDYALSQLRRDFGGKSDAIDQAMALLNQQTGLIGEDWAVNLAYRVFEAAKLGKPVRDLEPDERALLVDLDHLVSLAPDARFTYLSRLEPRLADMARSVTNALKGDERRRQAIADEREFSTTDVSDDRQTRRRWLASLLESEQWFDSVTHNLTEIAGPEATSEYPVLKTDYVLCFVSDYLRLKAGWEIDLDE